MFLAAAMTVSLATCADTTENNAGKKTEETSAGQSVSKKAAESEAALKEAPGENTPGQATSDEKASGENALEQSVVRQSCETGGSMLLIVAEERGYLKDEGITIEYVEANANAGTMTLLATGKTDVVSGAGTSNLLQQIASGTGLIIFGGHMVGGYMPVAVKAGVKWNGIESFVGRKAAANSSYSVSTGAVIDLGYDNLLEAVDWKIYSDYNDALATVIRGDVEYAFMGTGQNLAVQEMAKNGEIDIVSYQSEVIENYSYCGMEGQTRWVKDNPNTVRVAIHALLQAQSYYESNKEEIIKLHTVEIKTTEEYVAAYILNDEHHFMSTDPLKNSVKRAWDILDKTGFLDEKIKEINIDGHINTKLYREAPGEAVEAYDGEAPEFYQNMKTFFEENDK